MMSQRSPEKFFTEVRTLLSQTAQEKGYNTEGSETNQLYEFVYSTLGVHQHTHALGEVVYKALRYSRKKDPDDLVKIAAWALLVWQHHEKSGGPG